MTTAPRPALGVAGVCIDSDALLMIRRGREPQRGRWSLPGGHVEAGELMASAMTREVFEETGLQVVCGPLVGWVERISHDHHFVIFDFEAVLLSDPGDIEAGDDAAEAAWVPLHEVAALDTVDGLVEFLSEHGIIDAFA
jgi:8-oxo-dGTP diphosphatase